MQANIVAAVQQELSRFSGEVDSAVKQLRSELAAGTAARTELENQVRSLASALETSHGANTRFQADIQRALEERLAEFSEKTKRRHDELNTRLGRVVDEANVGISSAVEAAARPILKQFEHRQDQMDIEVKNLDSSLRKFDDQAGQMVSHINTVTSAIEGRLDQVTKDVLTTFDDRHAALVLRLDEVSAVAARQQTEVNNLVGTRVDATEDRINERIVGLESRMNEEIGQRVADIDAHVGRVSAGLDDAVITLSDRIAKADAQFLAVEGKFAEIREELANLDEEAIDEMKDQISSALGQAELVRIEMDRFKVDIEKAVEKSNVRLTELETTVQDQNMDVETAVQLERLEEVERAVLMLDPDQFVRRDEMGSEFQAAAAPAGSVSVEETSGTDAMDMLARMEAASGPSLAPPNADHDGSANGELESADSSSSLQPPVSH
ncbi:hypothetical protein YM304_02690 [Ilumatobacter coccineus YM16-304]|uniref:Uncharacterized protein n=2 Tax=Ilumatobacter coccineus TaxID=467094 RepID=A0A6C7E0U8_ILUCY|nr:hypothetical protein YM304_02690 [Ilumatobacter coccineus YM16-304]